MDHKIQARRNEFVIYVCFFVWVYGKSTFVGYLMPNLFLYKQFYVKPFSLA